MQLVVQRVKGKTAHIKVLTFLQVAAQMPQENFPDLPVGMNISLLHFPSEGLSLLANTTFWEDLADNPHPGF